MPRSSSRRLCGSGRIRSAHEGVALVRKDEDQHTRRLVRGVVRKRCSMNLTSENTAVVLDSTSDSPRRRRGSRTCASSLCTCASATTRTATTTSSARPTSTRGCARLRCSLRPPSRRPRTSSPPTRASRGFERIYSLRHVREGRRGHRHKLPRPSSARQSGSSTRGPRRSRSRCSPAIQRRLARGTTDVEIAALIERFHRECESSSPSRRSSTCNEVGESGGPRLSPGRS